MAVVGDRVEVTSSSRAREGLVTAVNGSMIRVRWSTGEETSLMPGPGVLRVVGRSRARSVSTAATNPARGGRRAGAAKSPAIRKNATSTRTPARKRAVTKTRSSVKRAAPATSVAAKKGAGVKAAVKKATKKRRVTTKSAASKTAAARKATVKKAAKKTRNDRTSTRNGRSAAKKKGRRAVSRNASRARVR